MAADKVVLTGFGQRPAEPRPAGSRRERNYTLMLDPQRHIAEMDSRGVDIHVLSASTVIQGTFWASGTEEAHLCRMMNDRMAEWVTYAPDRFVGSIVLPLQDVSESLIELERCRTRHRLKVVNAPTNVNGTYLGDSSFVDFWAYLDQHRMTTFIHPDGVRDPWFQQFSLWNSIGQPIEETKLIATLIYEAIPDRFPNAQIVISHGGGYAPLFMGRLDRNVTNMPSSARNIQGHPSDYLRRFFYDTCVYDPIALRRLIETVGADRVVLGSDFPVGDSDPFTLLRQINLPDAAYIGIAGGVAANLV
jgi:aminocarboxymuconate-semialdehyde decarboxylase